MLQTWPMLYNAFKPVHCYYDYVGSIKTESGNLVTEIKDNNSIINVLCVYFVIILLHRSAKIFINFIKKFSICVIISPVLIWKMKKSGII